MKQDKEAITDILSAIAQAQLALSAAERAFQDMVKSMPTCREPDWLPQGFGIAGYEQGGGARQGLERHPEEGKRVYGMRKELSEIALAALRPVSRERVEKVFPGCRSCKSCRSCVFSINNLKDMPCKKCDPNYLRKRNNAEFVLTEYKPSNFCPVCGKPLTDEAVQMVMERLEALYD